jgi:hypothetical protein
MMLDFHTDMDMNYEHFTLLNNYEGTQDKFVPPQSTRQELRKKLSISSDVLPMKWVIIAILAALLPTSAFTPSLPIKHAQKAGIFDHCTG